MGNLFVFGGTGLSGERYCPVRNQWVDLGSYSHLLLNNLNNWAICLSYSSQNSLHLGGPAHLLDDITKYQQLLKQNILDIQHSIHNISNSEIYSFGNEDYLNNDQYYYASMMREIQNDRHPVTERSLGVSLHDSSDNQVLNPSTNNSSYNSFNSVIIHYEY